jgi:hypothetical protein
MPPNSVQPVKACALFPLALGAARPPLGALDHDRAENRSSVVDARGKAYCDECEREYQRGIVVIERGNRSNVVSASGNARWKACGAFAL